jgi:2-keto-3-deoxy-L-rhamnonate aldolase RhmA
MALMIDRLREPGNCLFGTWVKIPSVETVEIMARVGLDFIVVDMEHSPYTLEQAYRAMTVAQPLGMHVLVRVADRSGAYIQRVLDAGADGVLVPRVTLDDAARVVSDMVYSPEGMRGLGDTGRLGAWGLISEEEYLERGRSQVRGIALEDRESFEQVEKILDVPFLDAVFVGSSDLGLSSGLSGDDPVIQNLLDRLLAEAAKRGIACGFGVGNAKAAREAAERGFKFVMISNDASHFGRAISNVVQEIMRERATS